MTLILALANGEQVVMLSDRRLSANGILVDDESNKAALLQARDARLLVGFTGIAAVGYFPGRPQKVPATWQGPLPDPSSGPPPAGAFRTSFWMLEALVESAPPDHLSSPMIERFAARASAQFEKLQLAHPNKGVLFCFIGYSYDGGAPKLMLRTVSNFAGRLQSGPTFRVDEAPDGEPLPTAFMYAYGVPEALDPLEMEKLGKLVSERRPAQALVGKGLEILRAAANSPQGQAIGKQVSSAILPADPARQVTFDYHSDVVTNTIAGISVIEARGGDHGTMLLADPLVRLGTTGARASAPVARVPKVGRNAPCPCLSGRKFKNCHGAQ